MAILDRAMNYFTEQVLVLQIFYAIGILAALLLFVQIALFLIGLDGHHDVNVVHGDGEIGFVSLRSMIGFFVGFGWTGVIAFKAGWGIGGATVAAIVAGLLFMTAIYLLIRLLYRARTSGNIRMENAIGKVGRVYLSIPASAAGGGQVQVTFQGQMHTMPALTRGSEPIATGSPVIVREVIPPEILVVDRA
jgi:membrane protein implicated in regulation of membrane protease activity